MIDRLGIIPRFAAFAIFFAAGCYSDRWTSNYDSLLGGSVESDNAVLEESDTDEEFEKARLAKLRQLAAEDTEEYQINAGDKIEIRVYGHDDIGMITRVSPDGTIGMVFLGQLKIAGRTIGEVHNLIEKGLAPYIKHPVIGVTVQEVASETITISGAVSKPGLYDISDTTRLADAYALAGGSAKRLYNGVDIDVADLPNSILVRKGEILPVDFTAAIEQGDVLNNVRLRKGDYVFVAQRLESNITVCGDVAKPIRRFYEPDMGLIETLSMAGWMMESHWHSVIIIRNGLTNPKMYKVDVDGILAGKCKNIRLKANDIVYVPKDNLSEYNVFVRKLLPTAQLVSLLTSRIVTSSL